MIEKVFYGEENSITTAIKEIALHEKIILSVVVVLIFMMGVYPQPMINLTKGTVEALMLKFN
jgi:NADH-quinone oxidoreductase subunit M